MKKFLNFSLGLLIASTLFVSCSDDDDNAMPDLSVNKGVVIENGATVTITTSELSIVDTDTEDIDIVFTVTKATENGILAHVDDLETAIENFTQADIAASKIVYVHNGSQTLTDEFSFSVTDGDNILTGTFNISIGEKQISYFYVLNEGSSNGSITMINRNDEVTNNYFSNANKGVTLGQYPQSMAMNEDYAFIVVTTGNGSGYVEVANKSNFTHYKTIEGFSYPREIAFVGDKAYVSNGKGQDASYAKENNEVYIIDLNTMTVTGQIAVGAGPEKMVVSNGKLYVANSGGYSNDDKTVTVIDVENDQVLETITVKSCPKDMVVDANGDVWVYCSGVPDWTNWPNVTYTDSGISKITESTSAVTSYELTNISTSGIKNIAINKAKDVIYFMSDAVYAMNITDTALPTTKFIDATFYGMDVNPVSDNLWLCEAVDATTAGTVHVYDNEGMEQKSFTVGYFPNSTTFSY
ncbi:cadherin-like domain-containing protein [Marinifilum fragile]|uniref:cadherin-like domain-containing protein n=1 Tax=Marinifilum fragile TaxID=570161 RepID=UPI002AA64435|nr:cadherin-like domain-containing protein [Marinifilum fragile]